MRGETPVFHENEAAVRESKEELLARVEQIGLHMGVSRIEEIPLNNLLACMLSTRPGTRQYAQNHLVCLRSLIVNEVNSMAVNRALEAWEMAKPQQNEPVEDGLVDSDGYSPDETMKRWVHGEYHRAKRFVEKHTRLAQSGLMLIQQIEEQCPGIAEWSFPDENK